MNKKEKNHRLQFDPIPSETETSIDVDEPYRLKIYMNIPELTKISGFRKPHKVLAKGAVSGSIPSNILRLDFPQLSR